MNRKVVANGCFGGFGLSPKALTLGRELSGHSNWGEYSWELDRHDPTLVTVVETLGDAASDHFSGLYVQDIGTDRYYIECVGGRETVITESSVERRWL